MFSLSFLVVCMFLRTTFSICRQDWELFHESCYGFGEVALNWPEAQDFCRAAGGKLVEIETVAENDFLKGKVKNTPAGHNFWTGGTDAFHEGSWRWITTGEAITFADWAPGQPDDNHGHGADCVVLWNAHGYQWADAICTNNAFFICEADPTEAPVIG